MEENTYQPEENLTEPEENITEPEENLMETEDDNTSTNPAISPDGEVSVSVASALSAALSKIEAYVPTQYMDYTEPDIDAEHLNHAEQAIMRVTNLMNGAVDVINGLQSQVAQINSNLRFSGDIEYVKFGTYFDTDQMHFREGIDDNNYLHLRTNASHELILEKAVNGEIKTLTEYAQKSDLPQKIHIGSFGAGTEKTIIIKPDIVYLLVFGHPFYVENNGLYIVCTQDLESAGRIAAIKEFDKVTVSIKGTQLKIASTVSVFAELIGY